MAPKNEPRLTRARTVTAARDRIDVRKTSTAMDPEIETETASAEIAVENTDETAMMI
jgi:hypothetical protein